MNIVAHSMSMPESTLSVAAPESVYQLVKRAEINPTEVEDTHVTHLEVTVLWERAVLHVAHLDRRHGFSLVSEASADDPSRFVLDAGVLGKNDVRVVTREGDATRFMFLPGSRGEVVLDGVRRELDALMAEGIARPSAEVSGAHEMNVVAGGTYRMELGALVIQARVVAAGRRFAGAHRGDRTLRAAWGVSTAAAAAFVGLMRLATQEDGMLIAEDHDARIAELRDFVARERDRIEPPVEAQEATAVSGTTGAAHQGAAGSMGNRQTRATNRRYEIRATGERPQLARERTAREVAASTGIFRAMANASVVQSGITSLWSSMTEAGVGERNANGNINGDEVGDAAGLEGLDTLGTGIGGGGHDVGIGTGPIGTMGHGNCRPGEQCAYGRNHGDIRNRARATDGPRIRPQAPNIEGTIAPETIRRVVLRNMGQVTRCYEQGLAVNPNATGRVSIRFVIAGGGAVLATGVAEDGLAMPSVSQCIASAVRRWSFPVPDASGPITVTYPFSLMPADL
jgi:hypothetical protein